MRASMASGGSDECACRERERVSAEQIGCFYLLMQLMQNRATGKSVGAVTLAPQVIAS